MRPKHKRLLTVAIGLGVLAFAVMQVLSNLEEATVFFRSPTEVVEQQPGADRRLRVGGLVEEGSVQRQGPTTTFRVTDLAHSVTVTYTGVLPDLFREGQGVVAEGRLQNGVFRAEQVLAKHDETYMPPEVAESLKKSGQWQHFREKLEESGQLSKGKPR
jgi:cytochrome c-type biogenesis protein CcmE